MVDENYEISESSRYVLSCDVGDDPNNKMVAIIFHHASWEQGFWVLLENAKKQKELLESYPVTDFVLHQDEARELHAHLGEIIRKFDESGDS